MFGFSVYLNQTIDDERLIKLQAMVDAGFKGIFSSIHIPEDDPQNYMQNINILGQFAKENQLDFVADVSGEALQKLGISFGDLSPLMELGLTGLRVDYGISYENIRLISQQMLVALNASTIDEGDIEALVGEGVDLGDILAWHNYYPRPETGLGMTDFINKNQWLQSQGLRVIAFVAGDIEQRGPVFQGLPTLEKHRTVFTPFAAALDLLQVGQVDDVYIGDPGLSVVQLDQFKEYQLSNTIRLRARLVDKQMKGYVEGIHTNRPDPARDVVRSVESRQRDEQLVISSNMSERLQGAITIDNQNYGRYMGEVQVVKYDLPADNRVNVIGRVIEADRPLIYFIGANQQFSILWEDI